MNAVPLYFNEIFARRLGHLQVRPHPLLVMNVVFGMTVEDLSEQALAHLGYWDLRFPLFVYPGDTLISSSQVLDKRESGFETGPGIVHVRTTGVNQRGEEVCVYERRILVKSAPRMEAPECNPQCPRRGRAQRRRRPAATESCPSPTRTAAR